MNYDLIFLSAYSRLLPGEERVPNLVSLANLVLKIFQDSGWDRLIPSPPPQERGVG